MTYIVELEHSMGGHGDRTTLEGHEPTKHDEQILLARHLRTIVSF